MERCHFQGIGPQLLLVSFLVACLCFHIPPYLHPGHDMASSAQSHSKLGNTHFSTKSEGTFYLTGNLTVPGGENYTIANENLVVESLYDNTLSIMVYGNFTIVNSNISLNRETYSKVENLTIFLEPGSNFLVKGSNLRFPGTLNFIHSRVEIENSTLNTSISQSGNPYDSSLRLDANDSEISILNSTINGLYRQAGSREFVDGIQYSHMTPYSSSNATMPMAPAMNLSENAIVNSAIVNVTYTSTYNESNNFLKIGYNGKFLDDFALPFNLSEKETVQTIQMNFTGMAHSLKWMENNTNFYLMPMVNSQDPINILNLSEYFLSNDTVSRYGSSLFSYSFSNSGITIFNSTLGANYGPYNLTNGERSPQKLYMNMKNSSLIFGDSSLINPGNYSAPFFNAYNSRIYFLKTLDVEAYSHGIPVQGFHYSVSPFGSQNLSGRGFMKTLNATRFSWLAEPENRAVVYETYNQSGIYNYTNTFQISSGGDSEEISVPPFPDLILGSLKASFRGDSIPFAYFGISDFKLDVNGSGNYILNWTGNLSGIVNLSVAWSLYNGSATIMHGMSYVASPGNNSRKEIAFNSDMRLVSGTYCLSVKITSTHEHAFNNSGEVEAFVAIGPTPSGTYGISILRQGHIGGMIWGVSIGNRTFYTNGTAIDANLTGNATARIIAPSGYAPSPTKLQIKPSESTYYVSFSKVKYEVSFVNHNLTEGKVWKLLIDGKELKSANSTIRLELQPGTYNYQVLDPEGYTLKHNSGIIVVENSSVSVEISSVKEIPLISSLESHITEPSYYIPISIAVVTAIALAGWNSSHTWYVCKNCGSTRKRKKDSCPYCGK